MTPPAWAARILTRCVSDAGAGSSAIPGDLAHEYRARRRSGGRLRADVWYVGQVAALGFPYAAVRAGRRIGALGAGLGLDIRAARRSLARTPALAAVAVLSLAFGTGLTAAAVALVDGIWFAPLPWPEAHRLVDLEDTHPVEVCPGCSPGTSLAAWREWGALPVFEATAAFRGGEAVLGDGDARRGVRVTEVTGDGFRLLGLHLAAGRGLTPSDRPGTVAVLRHDLWTSAFGGDPDIVGRTLRLGDGAAIVVGVLAAQARTLDRGQIFVPLEPARESGGYGAQDLWAVARLAEGVDVATAHRALDDFARARFAADPELEPGWSARVTPIRDVLVREVAQPAAAAALVATAALVLLLTTANLASLLVARVTERRHELAVRAALGGGRGAVARAAVVEAALLAGAGGLVALLVTSVAAEVLASRFAGDLPGWISIRADLRLAAAAAGVTVLTAGACGALPLVRALGGSGAARGAGGSRRGLRVHDGLLGLQVALGVVLVAGAFSAVRSFLRVADFDTLGHRWDGITSVVVDGDATGGSAAADGALQAAFVRHPAVQSATVARSLFLGTWGSSEAASPVRVVGAPEAVADRDVPRHSLAVGPGYFDLFGIPVRAGRGIEEGDGAGAPGALVASMAAARALWPGREPSDVVGEGVELADGEARHLFTVVGVVDDVVANPGSESRRPTPRLYTSLPQTPASLLAATPGSEPTIHLVLRGTPPGPGVWREVVGRVAPGAVVREVTTVEAGLRRWIRPAQITGLALAGLAGLAVFLLALGVYGTVRHRMAAARREVGIRLALGADGRRVATAVAGRPGRIVAAALAVGLILARLVHRFFPGSLPLGAGDIPLLGGVAVVVALVAALAAAGPLRRAARLDPAATLRTE